MRTPSMIFLRGSVAAGLLACFLAACGGGSVATQPVIPATINETPVAATSTFCVTPSTSAQASAIPNTGGFTGTLNFAASATASSACNVSVTVATGADVATATTNATARTAQATNQQTTPILQISLDNAFTNNVAVNGATLNTPSNLNFPDGTYNAVITSGTLPPTGLTFVAKNGVLTLQLTGSPLIIVPGTTSTISLYARGVTPVETPAPTASPSAGPSAAASATPTPVPTASPTLTPLPSPTASAAITGTITLSPSSCIAYGNGGATPEYTAIVSTNAPAGTQLKYGWTGTSDFSVTPDAAYTTYDDPSLEHYVELSTANTATVHISTYPQGSLAGAGGSIGVVLYYIDPSYGQITDMPKPGGGAAQANAQIEAGTQTCP